MRKYGVRWTLVVTCFFILCSVQLPAQTVSITPPPPAHPMTLAQIDRLMTLTHAVDRIKSVMDAQVANQRKQVPRILPDAFWDDMQLELAKVDWIKIATPVYQRYFSVEEADAVIAFYLTPVGQKTLESGTAITSEMMTQGSAIGREIGARVGKKYEKEINENMKKAQGQSSAPTQ